MARSNWRACTCYPSQDKRKCQTISAADIRLRINTACCDQFGNNGAKTNVFTYLPHSDNLPQGSETISKAPKSAFYGDPCLSGQFRGALVISLQPARNAPQQRRTQFLNWADAVWASSAGYAEPHDLFDISGEGFVEEIDNERVQWRSMWSRGYRRVDLSRNCNLKSASQVFPL